MKKSTIIRYINDKNEPARMVVFTPFLYFLKHNPYPWDYMPFCKPQEIDALMRKINQLP